MGAFHRLIRYALISILSGDNRNRPVQMVSYSEGEDGVSKTTPALICFPYGLHANIPPDYPGLILAIKGRGENLAFLPTSWRQRPKSSPGGDLVLYQPQHNGTEIRLKENGDVSITTDGNHVEAVAGTINIAAAGAVNIESTGSGMSLQADSSIVVVAPSIVFVGDVTFTGFLKHSTFAIDLAVHGHAQGNDFDGDAQVDTGVPK